jgi:hypothetical protein
MATRDPAAPSLKQRAKEEFKSYIVISLYLAVFFCVLVAYTRLTLRQYDIVDDSFNYVFAIINALVIGKVILIGEMVHLGKRAQARPLYQSVFVRAFLFSLLVLAFHFLEEFVKRLIHGEPSGTVIHNIRIYQLIARSIIVFCAFLPLFAFRELEFLLGPEKAHKFFLSPRTQSPPTQPAGR